MTIVSAVLGLALLILAAGLLIQSEIVSPESEVTTPITYPTPMLTPASDFADGVSGVPDGHALFVEYWGHTSGVGECDEILIDFPT
jgi:hypothetical protein